MRRDNLPETIKNDKNYNIYLQRKILWLLIANPVESELNWIMKATRICVCKFCIMLDD